MSLYAALLGDHWRAVEPSVRRLHGDERPCTARGHLRVRRRRGFFAGLFLRFAPLPAAGKSVAVDLRVENTEAGERWQRNFTGRRFESTQWRLGSLLCERVGMMELGFRLFAARGGLGFVQVRLGLRLGALRLPLPLFLAPRISARARSAGDAVRVVVALFLPWLGRVFSYAGRIEVVP